MDRSFSCGLDDRQAEDGVTIVKRNRTSSNHCTRLERRLSWTILILLVLSFSLLLALILVVMKSKSIFLISSQDPDFAIFRTGSVHDRPLRTY